MKQDYEKTPEVRIQELEKRVMHLERWNCITIFLIFLTSIVNLI